MIGLYLFEGFLRVDALLVVPCYARWVMLFYVRNEGLENAVESIGPFDVFSVSGLGISTFLAKVTPMGTDLSLYSLITRLP